jgi:parvulin-like peptidyl-prolyl isomerase
MMVSMKVRSRRGLAGMLLAATAGAPAAAQGPAPAPASGPALAATVNGQAIPLADLARAVNQYVVANRLGPDSGISIPQIQRTVLDRLIAAALVQQRASALDLVATPDEVTARVDALRAQVGNPDDFRLLLTVQSLTEASLRQQIAEQILAEKVIEAEVFAKMQFSDADVAAWYEKHRDEFAGGEQVRVRHIFVRLRRDMTEAERSAARAKIDRIQQRLDAGEEFADLAVELSEDAAAASGGDLGWLDREGTSGPFQVVAFSQPVGQVSDVVAADYGYHILQVLEHRQVPAPSIDEVRPEIEDRLRDERAAEAVRAYIAGLRVRAEVQTFLPPPENDS